MQVVVSAVDCGQGLVLHCERKKVMNGITFLAPDESEEAGEGTCLVI